MGDTCLDLDPEHVRDFHIRALAHRADRESKAR